MNGPADTIAGHSVRSTWLPPAKTCAICLTVDDLHPGTSRDPYEAGGDLGDGALRHLIWLMDRHPALKVTLFVTADWRENSPVPTRRLLAAIPGLRDHLPLASARPKGTMRLDRHPAFVAFLSGLRNVEIGLHGLHHFKNGPAIPQEFQGKSQAGCRRALDEAKEIFRAAGLKPAAGMTPPGWHASGALLRAMADAGLIYVASARDIQTPVSPAAVGRMSGLQGLPLFYPCLLESFGLTHIPTNFQATNDCDRALRILEMGGLLSIKAHIVKAAYGHITLDGLDALYVNYLDVMLSRLEDRFGNSIWWAGMSEIAQLPPAAD